MKITGGIEMIYVTIPWGDLPATAEVTGRALKDGGYDARGEKNADTVVLEFRRSTVSSVILDLDNKDFNKIEISDIRFV